MNDLEACFAAPLAPPFAPSDHWWLSTWVGWVLPPRPPPRWGRRGSAPSHASVGCRRDSPLLLLRCGDVQPHPRPMLVAQANVTSLRLHWHTVAEWHADVVLIFETRLTAVAQQVMCTRARTSGWQAFSGAPSSPGGGGGIWDAPAKGGVGIVVRQVIPATQILPPKGVPRNKADTLAQTLWHSTRWCHVLLGLGRGADSLHAQVAYGVSSQPALNRVFWDKATRYVVRHGTAPQLGGGNLNFAFIYPLRAPPSVLASLLTRWLVDADLGLGSALGRDPLSSHQCPVGTRPSRIDGLLVDTRLAALLHAAERLPRGAIPSHALVRFDVHLKGSSQRVVTLRLPQACRAGPARGTWAAPPYAAPPGPLGGRLASGPIRRRCGPGLGFPDHGRGISPPRPGLPRHHPGLPPGWGHAAAGPPTPSPRQRN